MTTLKAPWLGLWQKPGNRLPIRTDMQEQS